MFFQLKCHLQPLMTRRQNVAFGSISSIHPVMCPKCISSTYIFLASAKTDDLYQITRVFGELQWARWVLIILPCMRVIYAVILVYNNERYQLFRAVGGTRSNYFLSWSKLCENIQIIHFTFVIFMPIATFSVSVEGDTDRERERESERRWYMVNVDCNWLPETVRK